jgi:hypothetical protein
MNSPAMERMLARLYTDPAYLAAFLHDADRVLASSGLDPAARAALAAIDRDGLRAAAESFAAKREQAPKSRSRFRLWFQGRS